MGKQREFSERQGDFEGVENISESEAFHLPPIEKGRKYLDVGFENIFNPDDFEKLIEKSRKKFNDKIRKTIPIEDIDKINLGLRDYIQSSTTKTDKLDILKASLLRLLGEDILSYKLDAGDEEVKQLYPKNYFENIDDFVKIDSTQLINKKSLKKYIKCATSISKGTIKKIMSKIEDEFSNEYPLFRGQGNYRYSMNVKLGKSNTSDTIDVLTGLDGHSIPYYERQLLNSYTSNFSLAEKFMIIGNNTRRLFLMLDYNCVIDNVFSSFMVSDLFDVGQYEILILPNENDLIIKTVQDNDLFMAGLISEK